MRVYLDGGYTWVKKPHRADVARMLEASVALDHWPVQPPKLKVWVPDGTSVPEVWEMRRVTTLACLGAHLRTAWGR